MAALSSSSSVFLVLLLALSLPSSSSSSSHFDYSADELSSDHSLLRLFDRWLHHHSKNYSSEKLLRFQIFKHNLFYVHEHNSQPNAAPYRLGLNRFADLSLEEFRAKHLGFRPAILQNKPEHASSRCSRNGLPKSVDWRLHGAVTPVKDQGQCGSCWAFSSTGAIEGAHAIATGELVSLSEQELVSCSHRNFGCHGGLMDSAFEWVLKNGGLNTEESYPYVSGSGRYKFCKWLLRKDNIVSIDGYEDVKPNDEEALMCAVSQQPVSVAINAGTKDFQLYSDGIFTGACSDDPEDIDHAVLAVGYGSDERGRDYWIVKNSWSESWGKEGYVHIQRSSGKKRGVCGIHSTPSFPVVKSSSSLSSISSIIEESALSFL